MLRVTAKQSGSTHTTETNISLVANPKHGVIEIALSNIFNKVNEARKKNPVTLEELNATLLTLIKDKDSSKVECNWPLMLGSEGGEERGPFHKGGALGSVKIQAGIKYNPEFDENDLNRALEKEQLLQELSKMPLEIDVEDFIRFMERGMTAAQDEQWQKVKSQLLIKIAKQKSEIR